MEKPTTRLNPINYQHKDSPKVSSRVMVNENSLGEPSEEVGVQVSDAAATEESQYDDGDENYPGNDGTGDRADEEEEYDDDDDEDECDACCRSQNCNCFLLLVLGQVIGIIMILMGHNPCLFDPDEQQQDNRCGESSRTDILVVGCVLLISCTIFIIAYVVRFWRTFVEGLRTCGEYVCAMMACCFGIFCCCLTERETLGYVGVSRGQASPEQSPFRERRVRTRDVPYHPSFISLAPETDVKTTTIPPPPEYQSLYSNTPGSSQIKS